MSPFALASAALAESARLWSRAPLGARALFVAGVVLLVAGVAHVPLHVTSGGAWEGPLSWRKPILFGISTGLTLLSLGWVLDLTRRRGDAALGLATAGASLLEVGLITMQTWRGAASHFNSGTPFDAAVYRGLEAGVAVLFVAVLLLTARSFGRLSVDSAMTIAVRAGMALLALGVLLGLFLTLHGHHQLARGGTPGVYGAAGVLKFAHGMPLHAIQILPMVAWALAELRVSPARRARAVASLAFGITLLSLFALWQALGGRPRFDVTIPSAALLTIGVAACLAPLAALLPARR